MGVGGSLCGPVVDRTSYDLSPARNKDNDGKLPELQEGTKESLPSEVLHSTLGSRGKLSDSENCKEIASQSQCKIMVTDSLNGYESSHFETETSVNLTHQARETVKDSIDISGSWESEKHAKASTVDRQSKALNQASEEEIRTIVDGCWKDVENSRNVADDNITSLISLDAVKPHGWRAVRLFVSSTFADYHAEREFLVKKVVPSLREWCEERLIHVIECDLRWGVPKDFTSESTLRVCLGEIDRCSEETNGNPFFLNMLGERYGWIPSSSEVSQDVQKDYKWIFPTSITHMEILHAAYRMQNQNAVFLIRNPEFLKDIPPEMNPAFIDPHPLHKAQLKALKEKLRQRFPGQVFDYSCQYDGIDESSGRPKVKLKGLEDFGQSVFNFFTSAISRSYPVENKQFSAEEAEKRMHDKFIELQGQLVLGREDEISAIIGFAKSGNLLGDTGTKHMTVPLIILGSSGSGKSSLMARCILEMKKLGLPVFYHFVGAGPGSMDPHRLVEKLSKWLKTNTAAKPEELASVESMSLEQLAKEVQKDLDNIAQRDESYAIFLDAVNQLADHEASDHMSWLPNVFPNNIHCVISTVTDSRSSRLLSDEHRTPTPATLHIGHLDETARRDMVKNTLGKYSKRLDGDQTELLVRSSGATNPLWLSLACEELRVFGVFETLTQHIKNLPVGLKELLQLIINRLTKEDESNKVQKVLCLLECSKGGLKETELRHILSGDPPLPMILWAEVRRTLKPLVRNIGFRLEQETLHFFHPSISQVVLETYLVEVEKKNEYHLELADYFMNYCREEDRVIFMVPQQLQLAGEKARLLEFLRKDQRSVRRPGFWKNSYYKALRCNRLLQDRGPVTHEIHICQFCAMQRGAFGDMTLFNKDSCVVCGRFTPWKDKQRAAMVCQRHKPPLGPPNMKMCFICKKAAFQNATSAFLCPLCSNLGIKKCAMLVAD